MCITLEGFFRPLASMLHWIVACQGTGGDQQIYSAVTVGVNHLHAGIGEGVVRGVPKETGHVETPVSKVPPKTYSSVHLKNVRQAAAVQINKLHIRSEGGKIVTFHHFKPACFGRKAGIAKCKRRELPGIPAI